MSPRFKRDLMCFVAGSRGNWHWEIERRSPPNFAPREIVAQGDRTTKIAAMVAVAQALREVGSG